MYFLYGSEEYPEAVPSTYYRGQFMSLDSARSHLPKDATWAEILAFTSNGLELIAEYHNWDHAPALGEIHAGTWEYKSVIPADMVLLSVGSRVHTLTLDGENVIDIARRACCLASKDTNGWGWVEIIVKDESGQPLTSNGEVTAVTKFGIVRWS